MSIISEEFRKKFDPTKPVQTRDGRKVEILRVKPVSMSILAFIEDEHNPSKWVLRTFCYNGRFFAYADEELYDNITGDDLVNIPTTARKEGWMNIYPLKPATLTLSYYEGMLTHASSIYKTRIEADKACLRAHRNGVPLPAATIKVEWEEEK